MRNPSSLTAVVVFAFFVAMAPAQIASAGNAPVAPINTKDGLAIKALTRSPISIPERRRRAQATTHFG